MMMTFGHDDDDDLGHDDDEEEEQEQEQVHHIHKHVSLTCSFISTHNKNARSGIRSVRLKSSLSLNSL